jgi:hypothetical protein
MEGHTRHRLGLSNRYSPCSPTRGAITSGSDPRILQFGLKNVTDTSGAVVPGAKVTVINTETNFRFEGVTNQEGYYYVPYLRPGIYNVTIEAAGFKRYVRDRVELRTNDQPRIDASLEVGTRAESVEVQGETPVLETETSVAGGVLGGNIVVQIPVLQKLTFRLLPYLPDTQVVNGLHLNGQRERAMGYNLDGLGAKEPVTGAVGTTNRVVTSSIDAISEVKAYATGMPAEFEHAAGAGWQWSSAAGRTSSTGAWRTVT